MGPFELKNIILVVCVVIYTLTAIYTDSMFRKIPNKITVPMAILGLIYQCIFNGWWGLADGILGFAIGFGIILLLWITAGGGAGDVKLMGGLSVWLGWWNTLLTLIATNIWIIFLSLFVIVASVFRKGIIKTKDKYLATGQKPKHATHDRLNRRITPFAVPLALGTWVVLAIVLIKDAAPVPVEEGEPEKVAAAQEE